MQKKKSTTEKSCHPKNKNILNILLNVCNVAKIDGNDSKSWKIIKKNLEIVRTPFSTRKLWKSQRIIKKVRRKFLWKASLKDETATEIVNKCWLSVFTSGWEWCVKWFSTFSFSETKQPSLLTPDHQAESMLWRLEYAYLKRAMQHRSIRSST